MNASIVVLVAGFVGPIWAQFLAFPLAATVTWWLNSRYTFASRRLNWRREWLRYMGANAVGWGVTNGTYVLLVLNVTFLYTNSLPALVAGSIAGMGFNFAASKWIAFK